jgi:hypothetical protein
MSIVVAQQLGEILFLQYIVGLVEAGNPVMHLYSSPSEAPTSSIVPSSITECTSAGYHAITLVSTNWTVSQSIDGNTTAVYSDQTFSFGTSAVVQGYYITDTSGNLLWLEQFTFAPALIPPDGGSITVTPILSMND